MASDADNDLEQVHLNARAAVLHGRGAGGFKLVMYGGPTGKGRPRFNGKRSFMDPTTRNAEQEVRAAWVDEGKPSLGSLPVRVHVAIRLNRPKDHFTSRGALSAKGRRTPVPLSRPDVDNVSKLMLDALNGLAWKDDAQVVHLAITREWTTGPPHVELFADTPATLSYGGDA